MKKYLKIFFILSISYQLYACSCGYTCPGFDYNDKKIISYRINDTIKYFSGLNDTLLFVVDSFDYNKSEFTYGFYTTYECLNWAMYRAKSNEIFFVEKFDERYNTWNIRYEIQFCNDNLYYVYFHDTLIINDVHIICNKNYNVDGIIYGTVFEVKDLSNTRRINSFIKVTGKGIIEFHDKLNDITWKQIK